MENIRIGQASQTSIQISKSDCSEESLFVTSLKILENHKKNRDDNVVSFAFCGQGPPLRVIWEKDIPSNSFSATVQSFEGDPSLGYGYEMVIDQNSNAIFATYSTSLIEYDIETLSLRNLFKFPSISQPPCAPIHLNGLIFIGLDNSVVSFDPRIPSKITSSYTFPSSSSSINSIHYSPVHEKLISISDSLNIWDIRNPNAYLFSSSDHSQSKFFSAQPFIYDISSSIIVNSPLHNEQLSAWNWNFLSPFDLPKFIDDISSPSKFFHPLLIYLFFFVSFLFLFNYLCTYKKASLQIVLLQSKYLENFSLLLILMEFLFGSS